MSCKKDTTCVACPRCNRMQKARTHDSIYWCSHCQCQFDNDPDEGGDFSSRDPSWRLEREERRQQKTRRR